MNTSGEVADLMVKEGIQITESAAKLAGLGAKNLAAIIIALINDDTKLQGKAYIKECNIKSGSVFITKTGRPLDRSNVWSEMKKLCAAASVEPKKVFPHNLRHLFARTYYSLHKDIVRLADILGHSSVETTRIYTMESGDIHRKQLEKMGLLRWQTT